MPAPSPVDPMRSQPRALPLVALPSAVVLPGSVVTAEVQRPENLRALERADDGSARGPRCIVAPLADPEAEIHPRGLLGVGTLVRVVSSVRLPGGAARVVLHGLRRVRLEAVRASGGSLEARGREESAAPCPPADLAPLLALLQRLARLEGESSGDLVALVELNAADLGSLTDLLAGHLPLTYEERACLLAEPDPQAREELLRRHLAAALERARLGRAVEGKAAERMRQSFLREQLEVLRDELGEPDPAVAATESLGARLEELDLGEAARAQAEHLMHSLRSSPPGTPEATRLRRHLEWMLELPWAGGESEAGAGFSNLTRSLGRSHTGLRDVKERVLEFLAVHRLRGDAHGTVLCFHGPPGTGKSSMGRAVARVLGRPFVTIPVGGMTHESELVGAPRQQDGGFPGAILQELHRTGRRDPVILLDEIDKLSLGNEGNAGGALLQLLDPDQNAEFLDHYLGVPFDLSACLFVVTANDLDTMPEALIDRLEVIPFAGYTESEKAAIARAHLLPRARDTAGLQSWQLHLTPAALRTVIRAYTAEAGVRQLQRRLGALARKAAVEVVRGSKGLWLRKADLARLLGPPMVDEELRFARPEVGVATGLAWTSAGGALLPVEALAMPGSGSMVLTGSVGEVMRESVQTALSWVRTRFRSLGLRPNLLDSLDLHVHFPAGGTPKDGPSAGIAIATALVSLITRVPTRSDLAMSGEMSLLGHVLPVGGLREKLLAAIRSGIPEVIVPQRNAEEVLRLPAEVRSQLTIHLVDDVLEVLGLALLSPPQRSAPPAEGGRGKRRPAG